MVLVIVSLIACLIRCGAHVCSSVLVCERKSEWHASGYGMCLSVCASAGVWEYIWGNGCCVRVYCVCSNVSVCLYKGVDVVLSVCECVWVWVWMCKSVCAQTWLCCVPVRVWRCKYVFTSLHMCGSTWTCVCTQGWRPMADIRIFIYHVSLSFGERQSLHWTWSSQIWLTQLCSFLIVCAAYAQLQEIFATSHSLFSSP